MAKAEKASEHEHKYPWPPEDTRQHLRAARSEMFEAYRALFPPEFIKHRRAARKEMLLAARSLIDRAIERIEQREQV